MIRNLRHLLRPFSSSSSANNSATVNSILKTPLYDFHIANGAKMVPFAGWSMPVVYTSQTLSQSHLFCRSSAALFDVSHMLQTRIEGSDREKFISSLTVVDLEGCKSGQSHLTVFTNDKGGIIDDAIVTKFDNHLMLVSNAGTSEKIKSLLLKSASKFNDLKVEFIANRGLLALQGPEAINVLSRLSGVEDLNSNFPFMTVKEMTIDRVECLVSRSGYTGEDGFELSIPEGEVVRMAKNFLASPSVKLAGLGARDSLRLEAGMCLYGHDIDETITPVEAGLTWLISKRRREEGKFPGFDIIKKQITNGCEKKRVGFIVEGPPAREGTAIFNNSNVQIGTVTSGCPSPSLKKNIAMGYVLTEYAKLNTKLNFKVRDQLNEGIVTKMPFVPTKYHK